MAHLDIGYNVFYNGGFGIMSSEDMNHQFMSGVRPYFMYIEKNIIRSNGEVLALTLFDRDNMVDDAALDALYVNEHIDANDREYITFFNVTAPRLIQNRINPSCAPLP